jgi:hypothetical protein
MDLADSACSAAVFRLSAVTPRRPACVTSLLDPRAYVQSNIVAFLDVLEDCRYFGAPIRIGIFLRLIQFQVPRRIASTISATTGPKSSAG